MSKSRRKQDSEITKIVGILFLELLGAILLLNLAGFAREQRTQLDTNSLREPAAFQQVDTLEKSLPKVAIRRYNAGW